MRHDQRPPTNGVRMIARRSQVTRTADGWVPIAGSRQIPLLVANPTSYKMMAHQFAVALRAAEMVLPPADADKTYLLEVIAEPLTQTRLPSAVMTAIGDARMAGLNSRMINVKPSEHWQYARFAYANGGDEDAVRLDICKAEEVSGFHTQNDVRMALDVGLTVFTQDDHTVVEDENKNLAVFNGARHLIVRPSWPVHSLRIYHGVAPH